MIFGNLCAVVRSQRALRAVVTLVLIVVAALALPATGTAAITPVGSPLSIPATFNTTENLGYQGMNTAVPPTAQYPNGIVHTAHFGADTALWNVSTSAGGAAMPTGGEAVQIEIEGCAIPAAGGPAPLTQVHFQDLSPVPGGGAHVNLTSAAFDVPVCGAHGAGPSTVSTFKPFNLCVNAGDYVDLNDEGGFVANFYRAGVPYEVLGAARGAEVDSFIRGNGTVNGSTFAPSDSSAMEGFAATSGTELLMRVQLGTGPDARYVCPGGSKNAPPTLSPLSVHPQTDGINHERVVSFAIYCRPASGCPGSASVSVGGRTVGHATFNLQGDKTNHLPIRLAASVMNLIRKHHGIPATLTATTGSTTVTEAITVKIL